MRLSLIGFVALVACAAISGCAAQQCSWTEPNSGHVFDFSKLRRSVDYHGSDGTYDYYFNACGSSTNALCLQNQGCACQETTAKFTAVLGAWTQDSGPQYALLNSNKPADGVRLSFNNGDTNSCVRTLLLNVTCGADTGNMKIFEDVKCTYMASITHPMACLDGYSGGGMSGGWIFILIVSITTIVYIAAGCLYKNKKMQTTGMESCPQIEFWRELPGLVKDGISFFIAKIKGCMNKGSNQPTGGFDEI